MKDSAGISTDFYTFQMAKKKKQKKAGIEKRRKNKQQKRSATKKRMVAQQPVQKKISPAKLKQNLKNIPSLIFEPELQDMVFRFCLSLAGEIFFCTGCWATMRFLVAVRFCCLFFRRFSIPAFFCFFFLAI